MAHLCADDISKAAGEAKTSIPRRSSVASKEEQPIAPNGIATISAVGPTAVVPSADAQNFVTPDKQSATATQ